MQLFEFQKKALKHLSNHKEALLALDMGLGKTITSLYWVKSRDEKSNWFCVVNSNKINDWYKEAKNILDTYDIIKIVKGSDIDKLIDFKKLEEKKTFIIISYNILVAFSKKSKVFLSGRAHLSLLIDESQNLKNPKSKRSKTIFQLSLVSNYVLLLSGDPISKKYENLFMQMKILGLFPFTYKYDHFLMDYTHFKYLAGSNIRIITGYKNIDNLIALLHTKSYFLKTEDAYDLPDKNFIDIEIENNAYYKKFKKDKVLEYDNKEIIADNSLSYLNHLRQVCSGFFYLNNEAKKDIVYLPSEKNKKIELETILESQKNWVIFYNFNAELNLIEEVAKAFDKKIFYVNGNKNDLLNPNWNEALSGYDDNAVALIQYNSGATGIDGLQKNFNYCLYFSPTLSGEFYKQSIKRINRIGQTKKCFYYRFIVKNSIEENIYKSLYQSIDYTLKLFEKEFIEEK